MAAAYEFLRQNGEMRHIDLAPYADFLRVSKMQLSISTINNGQTENCEKNHLKAMFNLSFS